MSHIKNLIIEVEELAADGLSLEEIKQQVNGSAKMVEDIYTNLLACENMYANVGGWEK